VTKKADKATPSRRKAKKLTLSKKTLKDLSSKDASDVKGGTFAKTALCSIAQTCAITCGDCRTLKCPTKVCTYVAPC
jgi:natural product precursor